jgi:small subunit ribosomal protein S1
MINTTNTIENRNSNLSELLDEYQSIRPRRGQIVSGEVIAITEDTAILDVGAKRDAIVPPREWALLDESTTADIDVGDKLPVYVTSTSSYDGELLVSIERGMEQRDWDRAQTYLENGDILNLHVIGYNRGGLLVDFGRLRGFIPNSLVPDLPRGADQERLQTAKAGMVGTDLAVKMIRVDKAKIRLVLSAKAAES